MTSLTLNIGTTHHKVLALEDFQEIMFDFCPNLIKLEILRLPEEILSSKSFLKYKGVALLGKKSETYTQTISKLKIQNLSLPMSENLAFHKLIEDLITCCTELKNVSILKLGDRGERVREVSIDANKITSFKVLVHLAGLN